MKTHYAISDSMSGAELKEYRKRLKMTQQALAEFAGISKKTVERWESSDVPIHGPIVPLLRVLAENDRIMHYYEIPPRSGGIRLWYMHRSEPCTLIDVNDKDKTISIRNYTDNLQFRAFGANEHPLYEDYEDFLKERCFPESRDKMKLILQDLDLPFYDPFLIVEKTEGRMAEDDFWISIER